MRAPRCASLEWASHVLCGCEGVLELLLEAPKLSLDAELLRQRHRVAVALLQWPHAAALLGGAGSPTHARLSAFVAAGPFGAATAPPAARMAEGMTL